MPSVKPCSLQVGGSCGYEDLNSSAVSSGGFAGSINSAEPLVSGLPSSGCGSCVQVTCNLVGNQVTPIKCNACYTCGLCSIVGNPIVSQLQTLYCVQAACKPGALPVILTIVDACSSCEFDAPVEAFDQIADNYLGSINVQAQLVSHMHNRRALVLDHPLQLAATLSPWP